MIGWVTTSRVFMVPIWHSSYWVDLAYLALVVECLLLHLPSIHPTVYYGIVHGVGHGQPVDSEINMDHVFVGGHTGVLVRYEEEYVLWKPTHGKYSHHDHHHLHNLKNDSNSSDGSRIMPKQCDEF